MYKRLFRMIFAVLGAAIGVGCFTVLKLNVLTWLGDFSAVKRGLIAGGFGLIFAIIFMLLFPLVDRRISKISTTIVDDLKNVPTRDVLAGTAGLLVGLLIAFLLTRLYQPITIAALYVAASIFTYLVLGYLGFFIATQKAKDLARVFTRAGGDEGTKKVKKASKNAAPKVFDTSVIIDGRVLGILRTGFLEGKIIIPDFVLLELQQISDSDNNLKRVRGRRGLDILAGIQSEFDVDIYDSRNKKALVGIEEVDTKLLKLSSMLDAKLVTNDYNLNKVAKIQEVDILNINELANTLKPVVIPGETMEVKLVAIGKERSQALAYLDDGTMIVVERGKNLIGKTVTVEVTSQLQTAAGRMIFADIKD